MPHLQLLEDGGAEEGEEEMLKSPKSSKEPKSKSLPIFSELEKLEIHFSPSMLQTTSLQGSKMNKLESHDHQNKMESNYKYIFEVILFSSSLKNTWTFGKSSSSIYTSNCSFLYFFFICTNK